MSKVDNCTVGLKHGSHSFALKCIIAFTQPFLYALLCSYSGCSYYILFIGVSPTFGRVPIISSASHISRDTIFVPRLCHCVLHSVFMF